MSKPDWAERLQRTFKRKYQQGYQDGWNEATQAYKGYLVMTPALLEDYKRQARKEEYDRLQIQKET